MSLPLRALAAAIRGAYTSFDIILLGGQSNISGRGVVDATIDVGNPRSFQYGGYSGNTTNYQHIVPALDPLDHPDQGASLGQALGPGTAFARQYEANTGRRVLLVPVAFGGTGLVPGASTAWSPYGTVNTSYLFAISQANGAVAAAQALYPSSKLAVIVWGQGEADSVVAIPGPTYQQALYDMLIGLRTSITGAANVPIIINQMLPEAIALNSGPTGAGTGTYPAIDAVHTTIAAAMAGATKVSIGTGFNTSGDNLHYGAVGDRLIGVTGANAVPTAIANAGEATPAQVTGLATGTATTSTMPLTWTAVSGARSYTVQYSSDSGVTWQTITGPITNVSALTNSATVIGLAGGTAYSFRVRANAYGATPNGLFSTVVSASTAAPLADAFVRLSSITGTHITESGSSGVGWTYTTTTGGTYTTDHAGTSDKKMPAGVQGSIRAAMSATGNNWILALVTTQIDPVYSAGTTGYKFGLIASNTGNYKVIVDGGASTVVGNGAVVAAVAGDILQIARAASDGTMVAQVARSGTPTAFTTIHTFAAKSTSDLWAAVAPNGGVSAVGPLIGNGWA